MNFTPLLLILCTLAAVALARSPPAVQRPENPQRLADQPGFPGGDTVEGAQKESVRKARHAFGGFGGFGGYDNC